MQKFLKQLFLFKDVDNEIIDRLIDKISPEVKEFERNELIYSPLVYEEKIGFIIEGACEVRRVHTYGAYTPLNLLKPGDPFGIIPVLATEPQFPTEIYAKKHSAVLFITKTDFLHLMSISSAVALNVNRFLADRIVFLNSKIRTFSGSSAEEKLVNYILTASRTASSTSFPFNRKRTSELLNIGRASLYRALDSLRERGLITYDTKKIYIIDLAGLERKSK